MDYGRFSILLAKHGCKVTHFDISQPMIYKAGGVPWCITYTFMPNEWKGILKRHGVKNIQLAGPGAYARTLPNELLVKIMRDSRQRSDFLDFCYCYDFNPFVCGMGKDNLSAQGDL